jgi:hypothetical protein
VFKMLTDDFRGQFGPGHFSDENLVSSIMGEVKHGHGSTKLTKAQKSMKKMPTEDENYRAIVKKHAK